MRDSGRRMRREVTKRPRSLMKGGPDRTWLLCALAHLLIMSSWKELSAKKKQEQQASIPHEWLIAEDQLPPSTQKNVVDYPATCGVLSARELEITTTPVVILLQRLASAEWSSTDVTVAFAKRAIVAHQLVRHLQTIPT